MYEVLAKSKANLTRALNESSLVGLPDAGIRWRTYAEAVRNRFNSIRTPLEAIHFAQDGIRHGGFESRDSSEKLIDTAESQELNLRAKFPEFAGSLDSFQESDLSWYETVAIRNGRLISRPLFSHTHFILRCLQHSPSPRNIVEIGGGYGAPGRLWMTNSIHSPVLYCDVDLPESLFFAENYFGLHFGIESTLYLHGADDLKQVKPGTTKFLLCPPHSIDALLDVQIDLVVNTLSLGEMSADYVSYYMNWLDRQKPTLFYSCNSFAFDLQGMNENVNFMSPCLSDRWRLDYKAFVGRPPHLTVELMFRHTDEPAGATEVEGQIRSLLNEKLGQDTLFDLIHACRLTSDAELIWATLEKIEREWDYLPKEVVFLSERLEKIPGASSRKEFIRFRERLETIVASAARGRISPHLAQTPSVEMPTVTDAGPKRSLAAQLAVSDDFFGSVEHVVQTNDGLISYGWAADTQHGRPVKQVCCFSDNTLVAIGAPAYERRDIVAGFGEGTLVAGFRLPLPLVERRSLVFLAATDSGRVGRLRFEG